jgi:hypothetical protein
MGVDQTGDQQPVPAVHHGAARRRVETGAHGVDPVLDDQNIGAERCGAVLVVHCDQQDVAEEGVAHAGSRALSRWGPPNRSVRRWS